jgi:hypothetical protein
MQTMGSNDLDAETRLRPISPPEKALDEALVYFEPGISVWTDPNGWMNANISYLNAVVHRGYFKTDAQNEYASFIDNHMIYQVRHRIVITKYALIRRTSAWSYLYWVIPVVTGSVTIVSSARPSWHYFEIFEWTTNIEGKLARMGGMGHHGSASDAPVYQRLPHISDWNGLHCEQLVHIRGSTDAII